MPVEHGDIQRGTRGGRRGIDGDGLVTGKARICAEFLFGDDFVGGLVLVANDLNGDEW